MRSAVFYSLAVSTLALFAQASPEPCSDHPGVIHAPGEYTVPEVLKLTQPDSEKKATKANHQSKAASSSSKSSSSNKSASSSNKAATKPSKASKSAQSWNKPGKAVKKQPLPRVKAANKETVAKGADDAVSSFTNSSYIPADQANKLKEALSSAINKQLGSVTTVTHTATATVLSTETADVTRTSVVANSTIFVAQPTTLVRTVTQNVTEVATSTLITTSNGVEASLDIQQALNDAFAAANLSRSDLNDETTAALEACLATVLAAGGMPEGYSCLTSGGADSAGLQETLNNVLEQFVGILPNKILESVFDSVTPLLSSLLPASQSALVAQIQSSIQSVIASLSGNSVTALEQVSACYSDAVQLAGNASSLACFTKKGGAYDTLQTATNSVMEQFIGVLPASLTTAVENIFAYNLQNATTGSEQLAASVSAQISNAINSVASSLSGNTVTLAQTLQECSAELIKTGNATAAQECITSSAAPAVSTTTILSIAQQFAGYIPSSFFTDLVDYSAPLLNTTANAHNLTQAQLNSELESFFNNATTYGAAYVTCISQVQECVLNAVEKTGTIDAVCPGPVGNCDLKTKADAKRMVRRSVGRHLGFEGRIRDVTYWHKA
ncbi:uncharacterized protein JCM10292_000484 [Rhodotorula paludigena]|uniref:uncharacterized protein n=1 Tax=Rhodotorula paludigena TaxID=86838 RepID=UPI0031705440